MRRLLLISLLLLLLPNTGCVFVAAGAAGWLGYKGVEHAAEKSKEDKERHGEYLAETAKPKKVQMPEE